MRIGRPALVSFAFVAFLLVLIGILVQKKVPRVVPGGDKGRDTALLAEEYLWWLPPDTETIFVALGPYFLSPAALKEEESPSPKEALMAIPLALLAWRTEADPKSLLGSKVLLAIQGGRNFRSPNGLGVMPYEGCDIIVLDERIGSRSDDILAAVSSKSTTTMELNGYKVYVQKEMVEKDLWAFYMVRVKPNIFLMATHEGYLRQVLDRMQQKVGARAFPPSLPEWEFVDPRSPFWAVRHFDRKGAADDPSSPFGGKKAANTPDEGAIGVVFSYGSQFTKLAKVYYFSGNQDAVAVAKQAWSLPWENLAPQIRKVKPGVVEIQIPLSDQKASHGFLFVVMAVFGHGVYL